MLKSLAVSEKGESAADFPMLTALLGGAFDVADAGGLDADGQSRGCAPS